MLTPDDITTVKQIAAQTQSSASQGELLFLALFNVICGISHLLHLRYHQRRRQCGVEPQNTQEL